MRVSKFAALALALFAATAVAASAVAAEKYGDARGTLLHNLTMPSTILNKEVKYAVYLPPDYDKDEGRTYPVFYLLHGGGSKEHSGAEEWVHLGEIDHYMDMAIASRKVTPMIVVMPDGRRNADNWPLTLWMNDADGGYNYADMFIKELIPHVEKKFRAKTNKPMRAIGGLSMGGYGALYHTVHNPGMFEATVMLSAGLNTPEQIVGFDQDYIERRFAKPFGMSGLKGEDRLTEQFYKTDPCQVIYKMDDKALKKLRLYIDCGSEDRRQRANFDLHWFLWNKGINHVYIQRPGEHVWEYWRSGITKGMEYATKFLRP